MTAGAGTQYLAVINPRYGAPQKRIVAITTNTARRNMARRSALPLFSLGVTRIAFKGSALKYALLMAAFAFYGFVLSCQWESSRKMIEIPRHCCSIDFSYDYQTYREDQNKPN